jgi:hypothetical protein
MFIYVYTFTGAKLLKNTQKSREREKSIICINNHANEHNNNIKKKRESPLSILLHY